MKTLQHFSLALIAILTFSFMPSSLSAQEPAAPFQEWRLADFNGLCHNGRKANDIYYMDKIKKLENFIYLKVMLVPTGYGKLYPYLSWIPTSDIEVAYATLVIDNAHHRYCTMSITYYKENGASEVCIYTPSEWKWINPEPNSTGDKYIQLATNLDFEIICTNPPQN